MYDEEHLMSNNDKLRGLMYVTIHVMYGDIHDMYVMYVTISKIDYVGIRVITLAAIVCLLYYSFWI